MGTVMSAVIEPTETGTGTATAPTRLTAVPEQAATAEPAPLWVRALAAHPKALLMLFDAIAAALGLALGPQFVGQQGPTPIASWAAMAGAFFLVAGTFSRLYQARFTALRGDEFLRIVITGTPHSLSRLWEIEFYAPLESAE